MRSTINLLILDATISTFGMTYAPHKTCQNSFPVIGQDPLLMMEVAMRRWANFALKALRNLMDTGSFQR